MPASVIKRANEVLSELEGEKGDSKLARPVGDIVSGREGVQLSFFQLDDPLLKQIRDEIFDLDVNNLTPIEALNKLDNIQRLIKK